MAQPREAWLDRKGKAAWIVAMILGFVFFWQAEERFGRDE